MRKCPMAASTSCRGRCNSGASFSPFVEVESSRERLFVQVYSRTFQEDVLNTALDDLWVRRLSIDAAELRKCRPPLSSCDDVCQQQSSNCIVYNRSDRNVDARLGSTPEDANRGRKKRESLRWGQLHWEQALD